MTHQHITNLSEQALSAEAEARRLLASAAACMKTSMIGQPEEVRIMARRLLLSALAMTDPEYRDVVAALRESEFLIHDREHQAASYYAAAQAAASLSADYEDFE